MLILLWSSLAFVLVHILVSGTSLRDILVSTVGEKTYLGIYSLLSLALFVAMIWSYNSAPVVETWGQVMSLRWLAALLMLIAFVLLVLGVGVANPTAIGKEAVLKQDNAATAVLRITRHPGLNAIALWALVHIAYNGDLASLSFFGAILLICIMGMPSIDAKLARQYGEDWTRYAAQTSCLPFVAIVSGRNRLKLREFTWWHVVLGIVIYLLIANQHGWLFGVTAV